MIFAFDHPESLKSPAVPSEQPSNNSVGIRFPGEPKHDGICVSKQYHMTVLDFLDVIELVTFRLAATTGGCL